jgi:predicted TIM-barrel fold metal-dependent hydrolase
LKEYASIPIADLIESSTNPRTVLDEERLKELAESIRSKGVRSPLVFGTDFPFAPADIVASFTTQLDAYDGLTNAEHRAINQGNALTLFPRLAVPVTAWRRR